MVDADDDTSQPLQTHAAKDLIMNARTLIALATFAIAASAGTAFAQEATPDSWGEVASTKSRAQVLAELKQARADGSIKAGGAGYLNPIVSQKSRDTVRAEAVAAARSGELARIDAEAYAFDGRRAPEATTRVAQSGR
jgi:hypothetical protein